jgi:hypothetical protein
MPKRSSKNEDANETAFRILSEAIGEAKTERDVVSAAAAALGRRGGLRGGPARAAKLSPAKRRAIAKKAAAARWSRSSKQGT